MGFKYKNRIPSADEVLAEMPLKKELAQVKLKRDKEIRDVFENKSDKFIFLSPLRKVRGAIVNYFVDKFVQKKMF